MHPKLCKCLFTFFMIIIIILIIIIIFDSTSYQMWYWEGRVQTMNILDIDVPEISSALHFGLNQPVFIVSFVSRYKGRVQSNDYMAAGFEILPMNRILLVLKSVMKTKKGLSIFTSVGWIGADISTISTVVAAAASVPFSSTFRIAWCSTLTGRNGWDSGMSNMTHYLSMVIA